MMLKNLIIFLFLPILVSAQEEVKSSKFDIGIFVLPEISSLIKLKNVANINTTPQLGISLGVNLNFQFTKTSSFRTGLGIGFKNFKQTRTGLIFNSDIDPILGVISESKMDVNYALREFQLPLIFQYKFSENFFFTAGCELNYTFRLKTSHKIFYGNGEEETSTHTTNKSINPFNVSPMLSFGYIIPFENQSDILLEPMFKIYAIDFEHADSRMYNAGLKLTYNFGV